ncbi:MAG: hypothetical protein U1E54_03345 [Candidatus Levybacteria bacterium]|nr:hypothetical protein [Candidatus Levybacteria bacterium]
MTPTPQKVERGERKEFVSSKITLTPAKEKVWSSLSFPNLGLEINFLNGYKGELSWKFSNTLPKKIK